MPPLSIEDAERIRDVIVEPIVDAVDQRLSTRIASLEKTTIDQGNAISALKDNQRKAMIGYGGIVLVGTITFNWLAAKAKHLLHLD